MGNNKLNKYNP